jgi:hypothetical protein
MRDITRLETELQNVLDRRAEAQELLHATQDEIATLNGALAARKEMLRRAVADASVFPLLALPDALVLRVLGFVGPRELGRLARCCRHLDRLLKDTPALWERHLASPTPRHPLPAAVQSASPSPVAATTTAAAPATATCTWARTTPRDMCRLEDCPFPRGEIKRRHGPMLGIATLKVNLVGASNVGKVCRRCTHAHTHFFGGRSHLMLSQ